MEKKAVLTIQKYISDLSKPKRKCPKSIFEQNVYSLWAAEEILKYVRERPSVSPVTTVEEFASKMNEYSLMDPKTSFIFSVAYDIALDVLDTLLMS